MNTLRRTAGIGLLLLGLTACGGDPGAGPADATDAASTGTDEPTPSPLDEYLGGARTDEEQAAARELALQVQQQTADCMQEAGFEYTPIDPESMESASFAMVDSSEQLDPEWVSRYGYGISTMDLQAPDAAQDPNNARVEAMSDSERDAYHEALYGNGMGMVSVGGGAVAAPMAVPLAGSSGDGAQATGDSAESEEEPVPGCLQEAEIAVRGERPAVDPQQFSDLFEAMSTLHESIDSDPRLAPTVTSWANCMADAGHPGLEAVADAQDVIFQRWADLNGWQVDTSGGGMAITATAAGEQTQLDPEQLEALKNDEIALAKTDLGCRGDYDATRSTVRVELETAFVEEHRAELELFRDTMVG